MKKKYFTPVLLDDEIDYTDPGSGTDNGEGSSHGHEGTDPVNSLEEALQGE